MLSKSNRTARKALKKKKNVIKYISLAKATENKHKVKKM